MVLQPRKHFRLLSTCCACKLQFFSNVSRLKFPDLASKHPSQIEPGCPSFMKSFLISLPSSLMITLSYVLKTYTSGDKIQDAYLGGQGSRLQAFSSCGGRRLITHNVSSAISLVCLFRQVTTASWTPAHKNIWSLLAPSTQGGIQRQRQPHNSFSLLCWEQAFNCNSCNFPVTVTYCLLYLMYLVSQLTGRWSNQNSE